MRFNSLLAVCMATLLSFFLFSCSEKEELAADLIADYVDLQPGKYIIYRTDSLVYPNFGRNTEIHKYQEKHLVDALVTDNLGRPSYRIFRFLRDSAGTQPWVNNGSYYITIATDQVELIEDNMRVIKLHGPVREGFSWKGNTHLGDNPYEPLYKFSNDDDMPNWDFYYDRFEPSVTFKGQTYTDVWTIEAAEENFHIPIVDPGLYASKTRAYEQYAKGIGLVYREYEMWEYQPNQSGTGGPFKTGFGVTQWMIEHN